MPEHIETRSLYRLNTPNLEQGKIELWIDMFSDEFVNLPNPVNIDLPKPIKCQLRVVIKNTKEVYLDLITNFNIF